MGGCGAENREIAARLRRIVSEHAPADDDEARHREAMLNWLASANRPLDRDCFAPGHATGSALVVSPDGSHVLLVLHRRLGRWLQPGGHAEPDDAGLAMTAARETLEETGVPVDAGGARLLDLDVHRIPAHGGAPSHLHFDFRYLFRQAQRTPTAGEGVTAARWFSAAECEALELGVGLRRMLRKVRGKAP